MKLPRNASHCGAVGAGELNFITRAGRRLHFDVGDLAPGIGGVDLVAGLDALEERVAEIVRRHLVAVVERDVVAQLDRHAQPVGRELPFGHELRDQRQLGVLIERLIEHELEDRLRIGRETLVRVPRGHVARPADRHGVARRPGRRHAGRGMAGCRRQAEQAAIRVRRSKFDCHSGSPSALYPAKAVPPII